MTLLPILAAARDEDRGAFVDEALRRGETYSHCAAGNHGHLSLQLAHNRHVHFLLMKHAAATLATKTASNQSPAPKRDDHAGLEHAQEADLALGLAEGSGGIDGYIGVKAPTDSSDCRKGRADLQGDARKD